MAEILEPENVDSQQAYRILLLGDDYSEPLSKACLKKGYEVVRVRDHQAAIAFLESRDHVDAAVAPAFMEHETVFDFLLGVRKMPLNENVPIMVISAQPSQVAAFCTPAVEAAAKLLGAYKFITMPELNVHQAMRELRTMLPERPSKTKDN